MRVSTARPDSLLRRVFKPVGARPVRKQTGIAPPRGLLIVVAGLAVWQLVGSNDSFAYPPPSAWLDQLKALHHEDLLLPALGKTLRTFLLGLTLATLVGVLAGALIGASRRTDQALSPLTDFFRALPPPAVISVMLLLLGTGYSTAVLMVVIGTVWPVLLNTAAGMRAVPPIRMETSRTLGLSRAQHVSKVVLPSLVPNALLGVKVAASIAFVITLFIEILGVTDGIGLLMVSRQRVFDPAGTWGLLLVVGICGYLINVAVALLERRLLRGWPGGG